MSLGVALLEELRPPAGWATTFALGTTYSLDLVTGAAALLALDGRCAEEAKMPLSATLRALERLRSKVRIVAERGCIFMPPRTHARLATLFDSIVRDVALVPRASVGKAQSKLRRTFHPKVWLVHHAPRDKSTEGRWKLVLSSRNLTQHDAWDLGICLDGEIGRKATNLSGLRDFATWVTSLTGDSKFGTNRIKELERVCWDLPDDVQARFGWSAGDGRHCPETDSPLGALPSEGTGHRGDAPLL